MATKKKMAAKKSAKKKPARKKKPKAKAKPKPKAKKKTKKSPPKKKATKKKTQLRPLGPPDIDGVLLGRVEDFYAHINVIAITLKSSLRIGQAIHVKGHTTDFTEPVVSMQIDHQAVETANRGDAVGIKILGVARKRDWVFRVDRD